MFFVFLFFLRIFFPKVFQANVDASSTVKVLFNSSVLGKYIRIHPISCSIRCALRMELYGCSSTGGIVIIFYIGILVTEIYCFTKALNPNV